MNPTDKLARKMALENVNKHRADGGYPPLKRLEREWWNLYHREWIAKARIRIALENIE